MFKYCHLAEANETFHALSWSVLAPDNCPYGSAKSFTTSNSAINNNNNNNTDWVYVLAVAGSAGTIKLINLNQTVCYRCLKGHKRSIVGLRFLRSNQRLLLSTCADSFVEGNYKKIKGASEDCSVRLWNIGSLADSTSGAQEDWRFVFQ
jgi:WD40 repeat protein